jgi:hypothetical protein
MDQRGRAGEAIWRKESPVTVRRGIDWQVRTDMEC